MVEQALCMAVGIHMAFVEKPSTLLSKMCQGVLLATIARLVYRLTLETLRSPP